MRMINLRNDRNSWKMRSTRITRSIRNTLSEGMSESMYCRIAYPRRSVFSIYALLGVHPPEIEALRVSSDAETKFRCILFLQLRDSQFKAQLDFTCRLVSLIQELVPTRLAAAQPRA